MNTGEQDKDIEEQCLNALSHSKERIQNALLRLVDARSEHDVIWEAYSQAELGIGLAKLAFRDRIESKVGRFRELYRIDTNEKARGDNIKKLELNLKVSKDNLDLSISSLKEGNVEQGLEHARKARDILKSILLENSRNSSKKKKMSKN